jgi:hypothetical protein
MIVVILVRQKITGQLFEREAVDRECLVMDRGLTRHGRDEARLALRRTLHVERLVWPIIVGFRKYADHRVAQPLVPPAVNPTAI